MNPLSLSSLGEFGLIARLRARLSEGTTFAGAASRVLVGIGDDCAVLQASGDKQLLVTTDALLENVHFRLDFGTARQLGWRTLAVNISDIAAMGGTPTAAVVCVGLTDGLTVEFVDELYAGIAECAERFGVSIVGGDTVKSPTALMLAVTLLGEVEPAHLILRSGAQPGDALLVTGSLGDASAGLALMLHPNHERQRATFAQLIAAHCLPQPRVAEMRAAVATGAVHAAIDLSDGLGGDLRRLAEESRVGAEVIAGALPISAACRAAAAALHRSPLEFAISGGEDYELLMAVAADKKDAVTQAIHQTTGTPVTCIGHITDRTGELWLREASGRTTALGKGYEHFGNGDASPADKPPDPASM
ncbi:MAG: thiamine-phosphate kinase [Abditibacteriales bacterium]|nr:thiamine-phosphate kinase [Abditibacteriales bacterium]MDW8365180.1 thiamine-phosphate kinase [Abditibacteriales bacterium]